MPNHNDAQTIASLSLQRDMSVSNVNAPSLITIPDDFKLQDTEKYQDQRNRFRGTFSTTSLASFTDYVLARTADKCFVDNTCVTRMTSQAVFNLGDESHPGHADDTANLVLNITNEFEALRRISRVSQKRLIEFVQDYAYCLSFHHAIDGELGEQVSAGNAINAFRSVTVKSAREMTSDVRDMSSTKSALEHIEASSAVQLPGFLVLEAPLYNDLPEVQILARLLIITDDDDVNFGVRIVGEHKLLEDAATYFVDMIKEALPKVSVYAGTFTP